MELYYAMERGQGTDILLKMKYWNGNRNKVLEDKQKEDLVPIT